MTEESGHLKEAKRKIAHYCSYRERSRKEVAEKLKSYDLTQVIIDEIIIFLENEGFINEMRFTHAFAHDKFLFNKWGKVKIMRELTRHHISQTMIENGLNSISEDEYSELLGALMKKKWMSLEAESDKAKRVKKTVNYGMSKGFESELVWQMVRKLTDNN